jgi:hypothetical protein
MNTLLFSGTKDNENVIPAVSKGNPEKEELDARLHGNDA